MRGVALFTKVKNLRILGRRQVEAIEFIDATGKQQSIEADGDYFRPLSTRSDVTPFEPSGS